MSCNFHVGQKVVAVPVDESEREGEMLSNAHKAGVIFPKYGTVYTIRSIYMARCEDGSEVVSIRLNEIRNPCDMKFNNGRVGEIGFYARCFRPVITRKTDISIFTAMLTKKTVEVEA